MKRKGNKIIDKILPEIQLRNENIIQSAGCGPGSEVIERHRSFSGLWTREMGIEVDGSACNVTL